VFSFDARSKPCDWGDGWDEIDEQLNEALEQDEERAEARRQSVSVAGSIG
jgi:hypothetical protein